MREYMHLGSLDRCLPAVDAAIGTGVLAIVLSSTDRKCPSAVNGLSPPKLGDDMVLPKLN